LLLLIPFWVGEIVRTYAIMILLGNTGAVNQVLKWFGMIDKPIPFMYTSFSMGVGIVYLTALYMLLPLYSALEKLPASYGEAAADLGAGPWTRFRRVTLPLTLEGVSSGCTLVFLISTGFYATPVLLGGPSTTVFAETIAGFFHVAGNQWPTGAAFATIMFVAAMLLTGTFQKLMYALRKGDTK
jgi:spermidine/putrescine transport system permease protein